MTTTDLDTAARALYDACPSVKPSWDQLGDVTKLVWRERVQPSPDQQIEVPAPPAGHMDSLF